VRSVYEGFRGEILDGVTAALPLDAVLINVHGAMVADGYDDCEGDLLSRIRAIVGPGVAIGAEFDLHCHLTQLMLGQRRRADRLQGIPAHRHDGARGRAVRHHRRHGRGQGHAGDGAHDCRMIAQYRTSVPPISEFVAA
jgi:microcystin degradation protein MlrC